MKNTIRQIYFYAATLIFLIMSVVALISLLNLGLKTYLFTKADLAYDSCAMMPVAAPVPDMKGVPAPTSAEQERQQAACEKQQAENRTSQRQRDFVQYFSLLVVAAPLFFLHFRWVQKEWEETKRLAMKDDRKA